MEKLLADFLIFLAVIDPVTSLALFIGLTPGVDAQQRSRIAFRCVGYSAVVLVAFIGLGQLVLSGLGVSLESFQLAGGIIFFLFGLQMVFGAGAASASPDLDPEGDIAVFPLAVPSIASPGAILASVVLTDNHEFSALEQAATGLVLLAVLTLTLVVLLQADRIYRAIGKSGCTLIVRVLGLVLCSLAVEMTIDAGRAMLAG